MDGQDLKSSILQLAIQGELVEQREEEGSAKELLELIKVKKEKLSKEGKIRRERKLPDVTEEEILLGTPENWAWTRLSDIAEMYIGNSIPKAIRENKYTKVVQGYDYIATKDVGFDYEIEYDNGVKIPHDEEKFRKSYKNSILMCIEGGSAGRKIGILDRTVCFGNKLCSFNTIIIEPKYLYYYLKSPLFVQSFRGEMTGIIGGVGINKLKNMIIPIPPLGEQKRIVEKIEELMPYVDQYDGVYLEVKGLNNKFPSDMQKSILQYAIQGKLVEQKEEEGTAEELYQQIQEEKEKLIKERKAKKEKIILEITEDEVPFDIPENWKWVSLGNVINLLSGQDFPREKYNDNNKGIPYITGASSLSDKGVIINRWTEEPRCIANVGDVLLVCKGSGYGKTVICDIEEAHIARQIMSIKYSEFLDMMYIKYFMGASYALIRKSGQGIIPGIDRESIRTMLFPLPPLEEQKRIVIKIKELLSYTNQLVK